MTAPEASVTVPASAPVEALCAKVEETQTHSAMRHISGTHAVFNRENRKKEAHPYSVLMILGIFIPPKACWNGVLSFAPPGAGLMLVRIIDRVSERKSLFRLL